MSGFMVLPFFFPATLILRYAGSEEAKNLAGKIPPPDSNPLETRSLKKITPACQPKTRDPESPLRVLKKEVSFLSGRTINTCRRHGVRPQSRSFALHDPA